MRPRNIPPADKKQRALRTLLSQKRYQHHAKRCWHLRARSDFCRLVYESHGTNLHGFHLTPTFRSCYETLPPWCDNGARE